MFTVTNLDVQLLQLGFGHLPHANRVRRRSVPVLDTAFEVVIGAGTVSQVRYAVQSVRLQASSINTT